MATLREIRKRIEAASNIRKITQTMERISSVRVMRTTKRLQKTREYARSLKDMAADLFYTAIGEESYLQDICLLNKRENLRTIGMIVITSNQGMCGGFNHNVFQMADKVYNKFNKKGITPRVFAVGRKAVQHFINLEIKLELGIEQYTDKFTYKDIEPLAKRLIKAIEADELDEVLIIFNHLESTSNCYAVTQALLPCEEFLEELNTANQSKKKLFMYEPDIHELTTHFLPELVLNRLFQAMLESIVGEHINRRLAMQQASTSARDMITEMGNQYHALRKSKITRELNEIMGTVLALQRD